MRFPSNLSPLLTQAARCGLATCACVVVAAGADTTTPACSLTIELADAETGKLLPGLVQVRDAEGKAIEIAELLDRGLGLPNDAAIHDWRVLPGTTQIKVPAAKLTVRGFSGLETTIEEQQLDLTGRDTASHTLQLKRFYPARHLGWQAANTHVHMKRTSKSQTERYLIECSQADGLDIVYVSYLERPSEHVHYSTNNYSRKQLQSLSNAHTHFDHGEEHRHNFTAWEEGYGHVMLLNIPELIKPVSLGPGITDAGTDGTPLRIGIEKARSVSGRVIWCHNMFGLEDIPNWLSGRLDANNIFDGGTHGSYRHSFYRYLSIGLQVPFSTGTDWFMYDFSRVYVKSDHRLSPERWLDHLAEAKSYITNGPLLEFAVDGKTMGDQLSLDQPGDLLVKGLAVGRTDFGSLELVKNGRVIERAVSRESGGYYQARMDVTISIDQPAWLALRTPPPSAPKVGMIQQTPRNVYGREIFSHTSALFVDVAGRRIFEPEIAEDLLAEMQKNRAFVDRRAEFADETERQQVLSVYDEAIENLEGRIATTGH